jgi:hypothetical protein
VRRWRYKGNINRCAGQQVIVDHMLVFLRQHPEKGGEMERAK